MAGKTKITSAGKSGQVMNTIVAGEQAAAMAFDKQSVVFDELYTPDTIIQYKRSRVRDHVESFLMPGSSILELNAGTGEDAIYFASQGYKVHATDISEGMQAVLKQKVQEQQLDALVSTELCSFTELENLHQQGPYDLIFSNFAGLNCTGRLEKVLDSFSFLVKPGGYVTLVILPKFCLWEFLLLFRGKFKTALRRFAGRKGARAHIEGTYFRCWYYNPGFIRKRLKQSFDFVEQEGLCSLVPPSYMKDFAIKHPRLYRFLVSLEIKWKSKWPWRSVGDYFIITLRRK